MKSEKGQVLVCFLLILPLLILMGAFFLEIGNLYYQKAKLKSLGKDTINYLVRDLKNIDSNKEKAILNLKKDCDCDINLTNNEDIINLKMIKNINTIFSKIVKREDYQAKINLTYMIEDNTMKEE